MTLAEIRASLVFSKAAYNASLKGESMSWDGQSIKLRAPDSYMSEITRLERLEAQASSTRKGHNVSLANFNHTKP